MRVLVTGGAGFIGRCLVGRLLSDGHQVVVVDDYSNSAPENLDAHRGHAGLEAIVEADLRAPGVVARLFEHPYDVIYHLAASIRVQDSIDDPRTTFVNDVGVTFELLEAARHQYLRANNVSTTGTFHLDVERPHLVDRRPRFVFTSTCMVYDRATQGAAIDEAHPTRPASPYGASKIAAENLVLSYGAAYEMSVVVARPFNTYGPFQKSNLEGGVVGIFLANALAGRPIQIKGTGTQTRDLLFVEDSADFLARLGASTIEGEIINASTGEDVSINELAARVLEVTGARVPVVHVPHDHPQAEIQKLVGASERARTVLAWSPKTTLSEGLAITQDWLASRGGARA